MKTRSHKFLKAFISTVLVLATVFSVCIPASALTEQSAALAESVTELTVGDTAKLKVNGWNLWVNWSVDDENIAAVNSLGVVKAIGEGETTVTACARSLFGMIRKTEFHVVVNPIIPDVTIEIGESADLEISISGTTTWTTSDENIASVDNGTVTGVSEGMVTITATTTKKACGIFWFLFLGKTTKTVTTFTVEVIDSETPSLPEGSTGSVVTAPAEGIAYKVYMKQMNLNKILYLDGGLDAERGRYFTVTEDYFKAIDIYAESVNGGYKFYTEIDGVKKYIDMYVNYELKFSLRYADTTESVFKYDPEIYAWETMLDGNINTIGTYAFYPEACAFRKSYITPGNTRIDQFPLELTTEKISEIVTEPDEPSEPDIPSEPEIPSVPGISTGDVVTAPAEGIAYKFYMKQMNLNKILYLDGGTDHDRYYTTTTDYSKAIDIYAESVNDGYKFYTEIDGVKKYIDLYFNDEGKTAVRYADTTENIFKYNSSTFAWETTMEDDYGDYNYFIGTYNAFATASASRTAYITPENTRISQFPLELTTEKIPGFVTEPDEPSEPDIDYEVYGKYVINSANLKVHRYDCANTEHIRPEIRIDFEGTVGELLEAYPDATSAGCCKPF